MTRRALAAMATILAVALAATGCGFHGIYSLPLPGAVGTGSDTYTVGVEFSDVLDLVPFSAVKVNGATVGHVKSVGLRNGHALVECQLLDSVHLPANAVARIEETSLLGEKFVEIDAPSTGHPVGKLRNGDVIGLDRTDTDVTVEQVLGALSALLNGGGVAQIHTIAREVDSALNGRTSVARDLIGRLGDFAGGLDQQKHQILQALAGVDGLARTIRSQEGALVTATERMPAALQVLTADRHRLTTMLVSVQHLGRVAVHVIHESQASLISNLRGLRPTLDKLSRVGTEIPKTLGIIITYPTADSVQKEYFGDYGNLSLSVDLSGSSLATFLKGSQLGLAGPASHGPTPKRLSKKKLGHPLTKAQRRQLTHRLRHPVRTLEHPLTHDVGPGTIDRLLLGPSS